MGPTFFRDRARFRAWLERHHGSASELLVGFHKVGSGKPSVTYADARDEALCFGWIDGVRRTVDAESYTIRFTPRRPRSIWSRVNVARVEALTAEGRMAPAGLAAFAARTEERTGIYSFEREKKAELDAAQLKQFKATPKAWAFFQAQAPWYRRTAAHWVTSAKRDETRQRRLALLIAHSARGEPIPVLDRRPQSR